MAYPNSKPDPALHRLFKPYSLIFINLLFLLCLVPRCTDALSFNFSSFGTNQADIILDWDAKFYDSTLYLTKNPRYGPINNSVGRALYHKLVPLWEVKGNTTRLADFTTHFSFQIHNDSRYDGDGHGLTFALIPQHDKWFPDKSKARLLGLFESELFAVNDTYGNQVVAIEFDTHGNYKEWDEPRSDHMGIDVNSIVSKTNISVSGGLVNRHTANVLVTYNSTTKNLSASLTFVGSLDSFDVSYIVDLSTVLPERVRVGFTAATAAYVEVHELYSWSFNSSLEETSSEPSPIGKKLWFVVGVALGLFLVILIISGLALYYWIRSRRNNIQIPLQPPLGDQDRAYLLVEDLGPKRFSYVELHDATNGFTEELVLGKGGFGDVFEGNLAGDHSSKKVAVKKFRSGSNQGESEYVSEINVISRLKHKNLVQLKGWCHENEELILVYDFMPKRSLDIHLFGKSLPLLTWPDRYNIALGLASALHYLQHGSDPGVVHRDIKSSNIMLDSNFNAKLGDFGLAKLTNHEQSLTPTVAAGTLGYLAPEVIVKGKVSKASDIYSFGIVALEIACGRRPINPSERDPSKVEFVTADWVWDLYNKGLILEAIDKRLNEEYDKDQARRLLVVGLWCCHPEAAHRPSINQVIAALNFEASEPNVPLVMPALTYISPLMNMSFPLSSVSPVSEVGSTTRDEQVSTSTTTTNSM